MNEKPQKYPLLSSESFGQQFWMYGSRVIEYLNNSRFPIAIEHSIELIRDSMESDSAKPFTYQLLDAN